MSLRGRRDQRYKALAEPSRRHLLRVLQDNEMPMTVAELAASCGLHPNTVRDHLAVLEESALIERSTEDRDKPGRPRALYTAASADPEPPGSEGYRLLSRILASIVVSATSDATAAAKRVGREWGRYLADAPAPYTETTGADALEVMVKRLDDLGFAPDRDQVGQPDVIRLHDCPFREVARERADVVCSVHLGMLQGMAEALGGKVNVDSLDPFVAPSLCLARVSGDVRP